MKSILSIVVLSLALLVAGCGTAEPTQAVQMTMLVRNAMPPIEDSFVVGDAVRIKDSGTILGEITDVHVQPSRVAVPDSEGVLHDSPSPLLVDLLITIEGEAAVTEDGYRFAGEAVYVNNDIRYLTRYVQFSGIITEMRILGDQS